MVTNLTLLKKGDKAVIVETPVDNTLGIRLREMGFTPSTEIQIIGKTFFGGPIEILLRGYLISLRKNEASKILVRLI
jgi:ferrous iron transport protein A